MRTSSENAYDPAARRTERVFLLVFVLLAAAILAAGAFYYMHYEKTFRTEVELQLSAIAELKMGELVQWRKERFADGAMLFKNDAFSSLVRRVLVQKVTADSPMQLPTWIEKLQTANHYEQIRLLDAQGVTRLSIPSGRTPLSSVVLRRSGEVLRSEQVTMQDFYRDEFDHKIYLAVLVPILSEQSGNRPLGVLVLRIDPEGYLYPLLKRWPAPSRTAETLLIRREGNGVLFLNELRFRPDTALSLLIPLGNTTMPAVKAVRGEEGVVEGLDYRGVPVVADVRAIPDSPWFLVTRMDTAEVYAPMRERLWLTVAFAVFLLLGAGASLRLVWHRQILQSYRARVEANEAIRQGEEQFLTMFDVASVGLAQVDPLTGRWLRVNKKMCAITGYSSDELLQMRVPDISHPEDRKFDWESFQRAVRGAASDYRMEKRYVRKDNTVVWVIVNMTIIRNPTGEPVRTIAAIEDITERKTQESRLLQLNNRLQYLISAIQEMALARDVETVTGVVRLAARRLTGADGATFVLREGEQSFYADEDAIGPLWKGQRLPLTQCISGWVMLHDTPAVIEDIYTDARIHGELYRDTFVRSLVIVPIRRHVPLGAIGNYWAQPHGATPEEVQLLQTLADAAAIALESVRLLNDLEKRVVERTSQLESANKELEAFSYSVSHDLRAPLRAIDGYTRILLEDYSTAFDDEGKRVGQIVRDETRRLGKLIDDLLTLSRLSRIEMRIAPINMQALVHSIFNRLTTPEERARIDFRVDALPIAAADAVLIQRLWENLLANAIKFSSKRERAAIEVSGAATADQVTYTVRDNGAGFDMQYAKKLFSVFQRLHSEQEFEGTGVGLAIAQRVIHRHGGQVWGEGQVDAGATFSFTLPIQRNSSFA